VTGGAGFIGSHVADALIARGHAVTVLDDLSGGRLENVPAGAALVHGSITDVSLVNQLFTDSSFDYVYHLAAYARRRPELFHQTVQTTRTTSWAALDVQLGWELEVGS